MDARRCARDRAAAIHCLGLVARAPEFGYVLPMRVLFFLLLSFNPSHTGPEWQFGKSNLNLNCCKLQGNMWQWPAERGGHQPVMVARFASC
jgi:hypothetical protein